MSDFIASLNEIFDRRQSDIAIAKRSILLGRTELQRKHLRSSCILILYASLEGGTKELTGALFSYINRSSADAVKLEVTYLKLAIEKECRFTEEICDLAKQICRSGEIRKAILSKALLPGSFDTEANITPKVVKKMCLSLGVSYFMNNDHEADLNQLLRFRNNIAHGDRDMPVDLNRINKFSEIVMYILSKLTESLTIIYEQKMWLTIGST
ncbi:MAG: hypothetical protein KKC76_16445 [Proteobacteria bacterium]|nr:hypothetical protein [Pseudomonadota bacterium]MBU4297732.1 hypothetical protein [Pseudomonadota bacterium]MCG2749609.1 hypothetical protein [Desulfobulbaceae bacterium]